MLGFASSAHTYTTLIVDGDNDSQKYIKYCQVCCRPIYLYVTVNEEGLPQVEVRRDDE